MIEFTILYTVCEISLEMVRKACCSEWEDCLPLWCTRSVFRSNRPLRTSRTFMHPLNTIVISHHSATSLTSGISFSEVEKIFSRKQHIARMKGKVFLSNTQKQCRLSDVNKYGSSSEVSNDRKTFRSTYSSDCAISATFDSENLQSDSCENNQWFW